MLPPPSLRFAHYLVLPHADGSPWRLGYGAMGVTYKAYDERLRIEVALKLIHPARVDDPKAQALFLREARAAARIRHPHVASVLFLNDHPGEFFYAMEFVAGKSLQETLRERGPLPVLTALSIAAQIARGLDAIHAEGIIHRDLKPGNLMLLAARSRAEGEVTPDWQAWQVKIIDFGLARNFEGESLGEDNVTQTTGFRGSVLYASPEQCEERNDLDGRSDLYSLGCILWEMLLGAPPFMGKSQHDVMTHHVSRLPPIERLATQPGSVREVVARLLEKEPERRLPTADATARALDRCIERIVSGAEVLDESPQVVPPQASVFARGSTPSRGSESDLLETVWLGPRGKRVRWVAIAAATLTFALLGTWWWRRTPPAPVPHVTNTAATIAPSVIPAAMTAPRAAEKSIAVLPFENLSEERKNDVFANGVQDEILTDLAKVSDLKVISRSSVMQYKGGEARNLADIGRALGIAYVLEGSVKRAGDRVRVNVQLVDTQTNTQIWAERFEPALADIFAVQAEIASTVARQLKAKLTSAEQASIDQRPTSDLRAYELYLQAKELVFSGTGGRGAAGAREIREAQDLLNEAVSRDPSFFLAHILLAYCHDNLYWFGNDPTPARLALAQASIDQAERLRPDAGELHRAKAQHAYWGSRDYANAASEIALASKVLPNDPNTFALRAYIDRRQGRLGDAIRNLEKAVELSPREVVPSYDLAESYGEARRSRDFFRVMDHLAELSPRDQRIQLFRAFNGHLMLMGDSQPLRELMAQYQRDNPAKFSEYAPYAFTLALYQRDAAAATLAATAIGKESAPWIAWNGRHFPKSYFDAVREYYFGKQEPARENFLAARGELEARLAQAPNDHASLMALAFVLAYLGEKDLARGTAGHAIAIMPVTRDAITGANHEGGLAEILALNGERAAALAQLERLVTMPFSLDYGDLVHNPAWDAIRSDPRFQSVLARMAPVAEK